MPAPSPRATLSWHHNVHSKKAYIGKRSTNRWAPRGIVGATPQCKKVYQPIYIEHKKHTLADFLPSDFFDKK